VRTRGQRDTVDEVAASVMELAKGRGLNVLFLFTPIRCGCR